MATITTRAGKGSPLTNNEVDANFSNLNDDKQEILAEGAFVDGDKTKLDGIEASADVTDTANVTAAGALMDSELTDIAAVKALDQGVATTDSPSFAGLTATTADINGGTIDGVTIGGASAGAGTFTTLQADTSLNVDGTVTADGLTVDGTTNLNGFVDILSSTNISGTDVYDEVLRLDNHGARGVGSGIGISFFQNADERSRISSEYDVSGQGLHFYTRKDGEALKERLTVNGIGDINFYASDGTTKAFHWDAADESLGIGTTSPTLSALQVHDDSDTAYTTAGVDQFQQLTLVNESPTEGDARYSQVGFYVDGGTHTSTGAIGLVQPDEDSRAGDLFFKTKNSGGTVSEHMRITSVGNVGIGTDSPSAPLHINGGVDGSLIIDGTDSIRTSTTDSLITISGGNATNVGANYSLFGSTHPTLANIHRWRTSGTECMRIDSGGDVSFRDTSANQAFYWDASKASLGIGTTNLTPTDGANIELSSATSSRVILDSTGTGGRKYTMATGTNGSLDFYDYDASAYRMRIDSSGHVNMYNAASVVANNSGRLADALNYIRFTDTDTSSVTGQPIGEIQFYNSDSNGPGVNTLIRGVSQFTSGIAGLEFHTGANNSPAKRMELSWNGDIFFYEDTGATPLFTWDASREGLILGDNTYSQIQNTRLFLNVGSNTTPATSGTTQQMAMRVRGGDNAVLDVGVNGGNGVWLQATNALDLSSTYPLLLNPNGGNVGIGTATPTSPDGSVVDNPANGIVQTIYGPSPAINLIDNDGSDGYSLINFGRTGGTTNPYRAVIGYDQANDKLKISGINGFDFVAGQLTSSDIPASIDSNGFKINNGYGSLAVAYGCRAWVNFDGTGTPAPNGSGNVSSITDNGTGDYTVNFTNAMPDGQYCVSATGINQTTLCPNTFGTTGTRVILRNITGTNLDLDNNSVAIFR